LKSLHIVTADALQKHRLNLGQAHWLDIPTGHLVIHNASDAAREELEAEPDTIALPYLLDGSSIGIPAATALAHLGVLATDNTFQTSVKVAKIHASFHPSRL
jgi:hypothetical protein